MGTICTELVSAIQARLNCQTHSNTEWAAKWTQRIHQLERCLPHGAGIDAGTTVDLDRSTGDKLLLQTRFHHMNDGGFYDGWTEHCITVLPSFSGIDVRVSGRDRNGIKEYLAETFDYALGLTAPLAEGQTRQPDPQWVACCRAANRLADLVCIMYHPKDPQARAVFPTATWSEIIASELGIKYDTEEPTA